MTTPGTVSAKTNSPKSLQICFRLSPKALPSCHSVEQLNVWLTPRLCQMLSLKVFLFHRDHALVSLLGSTWWEYPYLHHIGQEHHLGWGRWRKPERRANVQGNRPSKWKHKHRAWPQLTSDFLMSICLFLFADSPSKE